MADAEARLAAVRDDLLGHLPCDSEPCATCTQLVPGEGPATARVVLVGEAPGATEDRQGRPFVGRAGKLLDEWIAAAGLQRGDVYITNAVKARPPGNRDPTAAEIAHHRPWLERELEIIAPELVVPLGRHALAHFARGEKISQVHGAVLERDGRRLFPLYHPSAALRGTALRATGTKDAQALGALLGTVAGA